MMSRWKKAIAVLAMLVGAPILLAQDLVPTPADPISAKDNPVAAAPAVARTDGAAPLTADNVGSWLDGFMPFAIDSSDIAGAVVVVVKDGQVLAQKGYGYADVAQRKRVDPETTLFRTGSISKLATWTAVMQLVERGQLDLDTDVNQYLDFKLPDHDGKPVTLRNIMTHTGGFQESVRHLISGNPADMISLEAVAKNPPPRIFAPGTMPAYSNYATALAGYIVQRKSGMSFDQYLERNIFAPLGMKTSTFRQPLPPSLEPLMSKGYPTASAKPTPFEFVIPAPAGSQAASGADMGKFMIAHLQDGAGLLKPETAKMMHDFRLTTLPPLHRMALGFYEDDINGRRVIGHGGDTGFMHSNLSLFLDDGVGLFISMNSSGRPGSARFLREALLQRFGDRYFPAPLQGRPIDSNTAREHARMMVGTYSASRGFETNFMSALDLVGQEKVGLDEDGGLVVPSAANTAGQPRKWVEIAPFVWRDRDSNMRLAAKVVDGVVTQWSFDTIAPFTMLNRVPWYRDSGWLLPAMLFSVAAVFLTGLAWPAGAIVRRRFKLAGAPSSGRFRDPRIIQGWQWLVLAVLGGWIAWFAIGFSNLSMLAGPLDPLLIALQVLTPIIFFGLLILAAWNAWRAFKEKRGWFSRVWAVVLLLAALILVWIALIFHLIGFGLNY